MRHALVSRVGMVTLLGVMLLSAGLVLLADRALAEKEDEDRGSAIDLRGVTQNWDKVLPAAARFVVLSAFNNEAVRDNETGVVWEKSPDTTSIGNLNGDPSNLESICLNKNVGGRKGWRLPSVVELASLVDPSMTTPPLLSVGHPFTNVQSASYWSTTRYLGAGGPDGSFHPWAVSFVTGIPDVTQSAIINPLFHFVWCVRGGVLNGEAS